MIRLFLAAIALLQFSCSEGATVQLPGGGVLRTHRSLFTKAQAVDSTVSGNGYTLAYKTWMLDETVVPDAIVGGWKLKETIGGTVKLGAQALSAKKSTDLTTRHAISTDAATDQARIAADVQKTAILNPVE